MRKLIVMLLVCLLSGPTLLAAEPTDDVLMAAAVREAARLGHLDALNAQVSGTQGKRSGGHPVLIGTAVAAGVGVVLGAVSISFMERGARPAAIAWVRGHSQHGIQPTALAWRARRG